MRLPRWLVRSLVGATASGAVVATSVVSTALVSTLAATGEARAAEGNSSESAVFARFSELSEPATLARLDELLEMDTADKYDKYGGSLSGLTKLMAAGATAKELEATVLPFVANRKIADAETSLAAIMLDYYEGYLAEDLANGELTPAEVFKDMIGANQALTTAAFGTGPTGYSVKRRTRR